jgi:hypothetical protein
MRLKSKLSAIVHNYGDVFPTSFSHHGDTEVTEDFVPADVSEDVPYVIIFMKACTKGNQKDPYRDSETEMGTSLIPQWRPFAGRFLI